MRLPNSAHEAHTWRIDEIAPDFRLEDVWALPVQGGIEDFPILLEVMAALDPSKGASRMTRALFRIRWRVGDLLGWDAPANARAVPAENRTSLSERLPADLRGTATGMGVAETPFTPLYCTDVEWASEISNRTVHAVMHLGWVEQGVGRYRGQMAVYVKPRGKLGLAYMAVIAPFRHRIVYPALMRQIERAWERRRRGAPPPSAARIRPMDDYGQPLREHDADGDPMRQFAAWFEQAQAADLRMPEAAALATASADGAPSVRMVLVKRFDDRGFAFFSNYASRKGRELAANPRAALAFYWDPLGRQVRIEGEVERTSAEESADYVRSRPRGSQMSALASPQSDVIDRRELLEERVSELEQQYGQDELPLPTGWGGYRLLPETVEFWQQRHDRLHDRLRYRRGDDGAWVIERLAP